MLSIPKIVSGPALPYVPTYSFVPPINERHRQLLNAPLLNGTVKIAAKIEGALRREDAAKLYELAYFSIGDIMELGTNRGLSGSILAEAVGRHRVVHTVELSESLVREAKNNFHHAGIANIVVHHSDAAAWLKAAVEQGQQFGFAFIDHAHDYEGVRSACEPLDKVMLPGSYVAFHDFIDSRNLASDPDYAVWQGAEDGLSDRFSFVGGCGCIGIYRAA